MDATRGRAGDAVTAEAVVESTEERNARLHADLALLLREVAAAPRSHDFFAVLRRIEALCPDQPQWGRAARPSQEPLRLSQDAELDFAPAALGSFDLEARPVPRLGVRFFGLFGSQGPLPLHITEYVRERLRAHGDPTMARFLDMFHHRLLTFFYRAWAQSQPTVHLDRADTDRYSSWLGSGFGFEREATGATSVPPAAQLFQAGLLGSRSRHPEGLRKVLARHFGVPVEIDEHVPQWLQLEAEDRSRLGFARNRVENVHGERFRLGISATSGNRVHDRQYKFRIVLGPLTLERYLSFIPEATAWPVLRDWIAQYAGLDLRWDVQLVLARAEVPEPRLGRRVCLGLTTWIGRDRSTRDRSDLRLRSHQSSRQPPRPVHA